MRVPTCFLGQNIVRHRQVKDNFKTKQNIYIVCQGSSALAKYSVQSRNITQAKIKMKKFTSRALFSHS